MNNINKTIITCCFIGCGMLSWAQANADVSAELVKLLHKDRIEKVTLMLPEPIIDSGSVNSNTEGHMELYKNISQKYEQRFKPTELKELINFYNSPTGKKLLKEYSSIMSDVNVLISNWEMRQLGMEEIGIAEDTILLQEEMLALEDIDTVIPQPTLILPKKETIKVESLDQLQALLKNNLNLFYDPIELSKLLNISLDPVIMDEGPNIIPEIKKTNKVKTKNKS